MKRTPMLPLLLAGMLTMLAGCSKNYGTVVREFRDARACCSSLQELPFEPLAIGEKNQTRWREWFAEDRSNPLPLVTPAMHMLNDLGHVTEARKLRAAVEKVLMREAVVVIKSSFCPS